MGTADVANNLNTYESIRCDKNTMVTVFIDLKTVSRLKSFSNSLNSWTRSGTACVISGKKSGRGNSPERKTEGSRVPRVPREVQLLHDIAMLCNSCQAKARLARYLEFHLVPQTR